MLTKTLLKKTMEALPQTFSIDELFDRLILLRKVQAGIEQTQNGDVLRQRSQKINLRNG